MKNMRLSLTATLMIAANSLIIPGAGWAQSNTAWNMGNVPTQYQTPSGSYPSQTDFIRDLNGVPCGIACSQRPERRQATRPAPQDFYSLAPR